MAHKIHPAAELGLREDRRQVLPIVEQNLTEVGNELGVPIQLGAHIDTTSFATS